MGVGHLESDNGVEQDLEVRTMFRLVIVYRSGGCQMTAGRSPLNAYRRDAPLGTVLVQDIHRAMYVLKRYFVVPVGQAVDEHCIANPLVQVPLGHGEALCPVAHRKVGPARTRKHALPIGMLGNEDREPWFRNIGRYTILVHFGSLHAVVRGRSGVP